MEDYLGIALRVSIMYVYALALLRLSGKRSISELTVLDFVVATIIGDMFDDVFWAKIPLSQGLTGMTTIILLHVLMAYLEHRNYAVHVLVASDKTLMVKDSRFVKEGLKRERTSQEEVYAELRLLGEDTLEEVREANWEPDGHFSLLKKETYKEVQKQDLKKLKELYK